MKKRIGRPPVPDAERARRIYVTLPREVIAAARELGEGNVSRGIRRAFAAKVRRRAAAE